MRRIAFGFLGLLGILLGLALVIPFFININDYKPQIISKAKEAIGREVTIDGKLSIQILPTPQLSVEQVRVGNIPGGTPKDLIHIKSLRISVELFPLLKKKIKIKSVELDHPDIFMEKLPNGQPNWVLTPPSSTTSTSFQVGFDKLLIHKGCLIYHQKGKDLEISDINATAKLSTLHGPYDFSGTFKIYGQEVKLDTKLGPVGNSQDVFLKVQVAQSILTLEGQASLTPITLKGRLNVTADANLLKPVDTKDVTSNSLSGPLRIEGAFLADGNSILLTQAKFELGSARPTGDIKLVMNDTIQVQGNLKNLPGHGHFTFVVSPTSQGVSGSINGTVLEAKDLFIWLQVDTKSMPPEVLGPITLTTNFNISDMIRLNNLNLNIQEAVLQGDISWQSQKGNPLLDVDLQTPKIDNVLKLLGVKDPHRLGMSKLKGYIQWDPKSLRLTHLTGHLGPNFSFAGDVLVDQAGPKPKVKAVLSLKPINISKLMASREMRYTQQPEAQIYLVSLKHPSSEPRWSLTPLDFSFLNKFDGHFDISASHLTHKDIVISSPKVIASLKDGRLDVTSFTGSVFDGSFSGGGYLTAGNAIHFKMTLADANLRDLPAQDANVKIMGGKLSLSLDMSTYGKSMDEMIRNLAGPINITAKNGLINGFDLHTISQRLGSLQDPRSLMGLFTTSMGQGQTPFTSFKGEIAFKDGIGVIQSMKLLAPDGEGHASGQIDLPRYNLNIQAEIRLTQHPNLPTFHMQLVGPIDNPSRKLDTAALQKYMMKNVFNGVIGTLDKGRLKAGEVLGSILGGDNAPAQQQPNSNKPEQIVKDIFKGIF